MKIAVQDDVDIWRYSISELLAFDGHEVDTFTEKESIPLSEKYDAVIIDYMLGWGKDGEQRLCDLRSHGFKGYLFLYTTEAHLASEEKAQKFDFKVISKDEHIDEVIAKIPQV